MGWAVHLVVPDIWFEAMSQVREIRGDVRVERVHGVFGYRDACEAAALHVDGAVMAAAVVNWIPAHPVPGKMETSGYAPGDEIMVPFVLAPRVIDRMRQINPHMTLVGCKMLSGCTQADLLEAAYMGVVIPARCTAVVANDMSNLRQKWMVYGDRSVHAFDGDFESFFSELDQVLGDAFYRTVWNRTSCRTVMECRVMEKILQEYEGRFLDRGDGQVLGSVYVPNLGDRGWGVLTPRMKRRDMGVQDMVVGGDIMDGAIHVTGTAKATLNAPLLIRMAQKYPQAVAVLHLHEMLPGAPIEPYAVPGSQRDNDREIPGPAFNIEGHGFMACLGDDMRPIMFE